LQVVKSLTQNENF